MPHFQFDQHELFYEQTGQGPPLVLLNGLMRHLSLWDNWVSVLQGSFEVLRLDFLGSGRSKTSPTSFSIESLADQVSSLLDHLDISKAHLLGFSLGTAVLQSFALKYPKRVLNCALLTPFFKFPTCASLHYRNQIKLKKQGVDLKVAMEAELPWLYSDTYLRERQNILQLIEEEENNPYPFSIDSYEAQLNALEEFDQTAHLSSLTSPCLLMAGEHDFLTLPTYAKKMNALLPHGRLEIIPRAPHMGFQEQGLDFITVIMEWLLDR